ncbi:fibrous sheath CABYR-binding protein-like [Drosophila obscura]|uniref:fibrous sheath CABYR-binding protein-like n=1 Tax=Drosophila obscura TaxID=7282 RepID=UPI001BB1E8D2|nr:fibrous sheath CABYR-binding protein-like [Drosophila obscura]XP_022233846.2 fibrous sheath CABYR-binding protein-like [Drosophila obscura]
MLTRKRKQSRASNAPPKRTCNQSRANNNNSNIEEPSTGLGLNSGAPEPEESVSVAEGNNNRPVSGTGSADNQAGAREQEPPQQGPPEQEPTGTGLTETAPPEQEPPETTPPGQNPPESAQPEPELPQTEAAGPESQPPRSVLAVQGAPEEENFVGIQCPSPEPLPLLILGTGNELFLYRPVAQLCTDNRLVRLEDVVTGARQPTLGALASEFWKTLKSNIITYIHKGPQP